MTPQEVEFIQSLKDIMREMETIDPSIDAWIKSDGAWEQAEIHERFLYRFGSNVNGSTFLPPLACINGQFRCMCEASAKMI